MATDFRQSPLWLRALDLAADLYRSAETLRGPGASRLAAQITHAAARLPVRVAQAGGEATSELSAILLEIETLLLLAQRLDAAGPRGWEALLVEVAALQAYAPTPASTPALPETPPARVEPVPVEAAKPVPVVAAPQTTALPTPPRVNVDRLIVDGHNFLGRADGYMLGSDHSRDRLIARLQTYRQKHPTHRVVVFFDGEQFSREERNGVEIRYGAGEKSADDQIMQFLNSLAEVDRKRAQIVTDDRELADRARRAGARRQPVSWLEEQFGRKPQAEKEQARPEGVGKQNVSQWEAYFAAPPQRPGRK